MELSERQKLILRTLIKEHVRSAQPVASGVLVDKYHLDISPATVRNELMALEELGYIYQPHTSAGRVPTERAYLLDLAESGNKKRDLKSSDKDLLDQALDNADGALKAAARSLAELSGNAVFWAFHKNDLYYTGLSNLFAQPEFRQGEVIYDVSQVIDRMEEIIDEIFDDTPDGIKIMIGSQNPFGAFLGSSMLKYRSKGVSGLCGVLGPLRLDYQRQISLLSYIQEKLNDN